MAEYTPNYNLILPTENEYYSVEDANNNANLIDREIKAAASAAIPKVTGATTGNMAQFTSTGEIEDSGLKFSIYNGGLRVTYDNGL